MNELRKLWCEDQYRIFQVTKRYAYCGYANENQYRVFKISLDGQKRRRQLMQSVSLESDWYWDSSNKRLTGEPLECDFTGAREEDVLSGHRWICENGERIDATAGLSDLSWIAERNQIRLNTGAEATFYIPPGATKWLVSLHGGPESYECREIRYGGFYRDLLTQDIAVVVLNYCGSKKPDGEILGGTQAWGRWRESIEADFVELLAQARKWNLYQENVSLLGASFGGALALILRNRFRVQNTILSSPLLDLTTQIQRGGSEYRDWFATRFSALDLKDFSFEQLIQTGPGKVSLTYGKHDEVLGEEMFIRVRNTNWNVQTRSGGHVPHSYAEHRQQREFFASVICNLLAKD